jgi:glycosyltransferase involved in cell wall biosynthesis
VGRLSKEKGVDQLIKALPLIRERVPGAGLTVVGDGPDRALLEHLARQQGVEAAVTFTGPVDNHLLGDYYRGSIACVLPSLWMENCPVTALESLSHGTPLLASDLGGLPEIVNDEVNGLLFPPGDHQRLAQQAVRLLLDRELAGQLGAAALETFQRDYSPDAHFTRLSALYEVLIG